MNLNLVPIHLAEIFGFSGFEISPVLIPIAAIILGGVITVSGMYFHHRRLELWHQTARLALEKGRPLPPPLEDEDKPSPDRQRDESRNDFRAGLILVATGAGLWLFLGTFLSRGLGFVGAIPGFIGVALLLHGVLSLAFQKKPSTHDEHRPKS